MSEILSHYKTNLINNYFYFWALVLPITSVLIIPSIQGTTPAYVLALGAIILFFFTIKIDKNTYIKDLIIFLYIFILINALGQLFLLFNIEEINLLGLVLVDPKDESLLLRSSLFTQSIYLLAGLSTFFFVKNFYNLSWDRYIIIGAIILATYGIYEWFYFLIFQEKGDFLSNRTFDEGFSGSLFQTLQLGPVLVQRLKSLTGEPSMYAFTVLPYWIYTIHTQRKYISFFLLITLILTTSTTAYIGIIMYMFLRVFYTKKINWKNVPIYILSLIPLIFIIGVNNIKYYFNTLILAKLLQQNQSGADRFSYFSYHFDYFVQLPIFSKLFGLGFGTIRSTDMFTTILVNNGIVGLVLLTLLFLYPIYKLKNNFRNIGLKISLIVLFISMMVSIPEFAYLSMWLFLGIAYNEIKIKQIIK